MDDKLESLTRMDRVTLRVWRFGNTLGWFLASNAVAALIQLAREGALVRLSDRGIVVTTPIALGVNLAFCAATAMAVGGIVGSRVWRDQVGIAIAVLLLTLGTSAWRNPATLSIPALACIPLGIFWTRRVAKRRRV